MARGRRTFPRRSQPLEGITETDWLPYTFTMNWQISAASSR